VRDALQHGISNRIELLPKAKSMPSVLRCQPKKGSARDINPREFIDVSMGTVQRLQRERENNNTVRLFASKKRPIEDATMQNANTLAHTSDSALVPSKRQRVNGVATTSNNNKPIKDKSKRARDKLCEFIAALPPWSCMDSGEVVELTVYQQRERSRIRGRGRGSDKGPGEM
jgi:hypothetical protein